MKILNQHDPVQAVRSIQLFLQRPNQRQTALKWMLALDFSMVREVLADFLGGTVSDEDFEMGLSLFQINPDPGNIYSLFRLKKGVPENRKEAIQLVWNATLTTLRELQIVSEERCKALEEEFQKRYDDDQRRQALPSPAYSVKSLEKPLIVDSHESFLGGGPGISRNLLAAGVLLCFLVGGFVWMFPTTGLRHSFNTKKTPSPLGKEGMLSNRSAGSGSEKATQGPTFDTALFDAPGPEVQEFLNADRRRADLFAETSQMLKGGNK